MTTTIARRVLVLVLLAATGVAVAAIVSGGDDGYVLYAKFRQAGGLREGFHVRIDGAPVGKIEELSLDSDDLVVARLRIDESAAPVGRDARATARAADLLGEKFVAIEPGDRGDPAPSGTEIPPDRTGLAVELDDVINTIDLPTREALRAFIGEQGSAFVGRGRDLAEMLAALPSSLDRTGELLDQFAGDNRALGRLVEESDRVVASVARERQSLGRLVSSAEGTLSILGRRRQELGAAVQRAPATLASARRALAALQGAAVPLGAAARGLRETTPELTRTLLELPEFTAAARPTLRTVREVTPALERLGREGAPVVRRLRPLTGELESFAGSFEPVTQTLDEGAPDILGVLEGWARATQARDGASHVFRFGLTVGPAAFADVADLMGGDGRRTQTTAQRREGAPRAAGPEADERDTRRQQGRSEASPDLDDAAPDLGDAGPQSTDGVQQLLDYLLK